MNKPQHRSGYRREETELVVSACLTVAIKLGNLMDHFCIVGGLDDLKVTIDFLIPPLPGDDEGRRVRPLEGDFGALISPGLEVAFDERRLIALDGQTLKGERTKRQIPVCGPGAFVLLKALAFSERAEPKDAYDLAYVLRCWPAGIGDIADRIRKLAVNRPGEVAHALDCLANDFEDPDRLGPMRAAAFEARPGANLDDAAADAHGFVDDLLRACRQGEPSIQR